MSNPNITNRHDLPLPLAVWLLKNDYDYIDEENYISATGLLKPVRSNILSQRAKDIGNYELDISDLIASSRGTAIHDSFEKAWSPEGFPLAMKQLGYSDHIIDKVVINPEPSEVKDDQVPIYLEKRGFVELDGFKIGGKFDFVAEGLLHDVKHTSVYKYLDDSGDADYVLQGSIYRLTHENIITENYIRILFVFSDWQRSRAEADPNYPQAAVGFKDIQLMSVNATKNWIRDRLKQFTDNVDLPQDQMLRCPDDELWLDKPVYKYYANPQKLGRATKNFDDPREANQHLTNQGKGIVIPTTPKPKRCMYCPAYDICEQRKDYYPDD